MEDRPSDTVVNQRIRNRIIEYLEGAADRESHRDTFGHPGEAINQWEDWYLPAWVPKYLPPVFTQEEIDAMQSFNDVWDRTADAVHEDALFEDPRDVNAWQQLADAARRCLAIFARRGKLSEDEEIVA